jgi:hypothetical protein
MEDLPGSGTGDRKVRVLANPCGLRLPLVGARGFEPPTSRSRTVRAKPICATPRRFTHSKAVKIIPYLHQNDKYNLSRCERGGVK